MLTDELAEFFSGKCPTGKSHDSELRRQMLVDVEVKQRRQELTPRQVAGDAENNEYGGGHD